MLVGLSCARSFLLMCRCAAFKGQFVYWQLLLNPIFVKRRVTLCQMEDTENNTSMEHEEFDLDTLTDLIDEDDFLSQETSEIDVAVTAPSLGDNTAKINSAVNSGNSDFKNGSINSVPPNCLSPAFNNSEISNTSRETISTLASQGCTDNGQNSKNLKSKNNIRVLTDIPIDKFETELGLLNVDGKARGKSLAKDIAHTAFSKKVDSLVHTGDTDSSDEESRDYLTETGKMIKKKVAVRNNYDKPEPKTFKTWKTEPKQKSITDHLEVSTGQKTSFVTDHLSGIRIVNPLVPLSIFESKLCGRRVIKMSFIRNFMKKGDIEGDWVTVGVLVSKLPPKTSKNGKTYSIWKMTDLIDPEKLVTVFLFGAVHAEHWKTAVGMVIGILNPSFMPDRDGHRSEEITLSVDHPGKFMMMGTSKDFGHCKGRRKDGMSCTSVVNKSQGDFCIYHIKKEYKKMSSKRTDLQSSYSGKEPNLKNKILKGGAVMYGGQLYSQPAPVPRKSGSQASSKDKLTLNNLTLKRKAEAVESEAEENAKNQKKLTELYNVEHATAVKVSTQSQFIKQQLSIPSAGSRNLVQYFAKEEQHAEIKKKEFKSITAKEFLKMHAQQLKEKQMKMQNQNANTSPMLKSISEIENSPILKNIRPQIARGIQPGQDISFDISTPIRFQSYTSKDVAKLKAIEKMKSKGPIQPMDPNAVKKSMKSVDTLNKIKLALEKADETTAAATEKPENKKQHSILGSIDLNSERIKKILNRKSSHAHEAEMDEVEKQESYFNRLEKKEQMEEKMASTTKIVCKVVSCKVCKYTAEVALNFCKDNDHPLQWHKAVKRFFECTSCKHHTSSFNKYPTKACSSCSSSSFVPSGMMKARLAKKTADEELVIRGGDIECLNSLSNRKF